MFICYFDNMIGWVDVVLVEKLGFVCVGNFVVICYFFDMVLWFGVFVNIEVLGYDGCEL